MAVTTAAVVGTAAAVKSSSDQRKASKKAMQSQERQNESNAQFIAQQTAKARAEAVPLFAESQQAREGGFQKALDVFGQTIPRQIQATQAGSLGAQQALLSGLPQIQSAILGQPVNFNQLAPKQIGVNTSFARQSLAKTPQSVSRALSGALSPAQQQPQVTQSPVRQQVESDAVRRLRIDASRSGGRKRAIARKKLRDLGLM